VFERGQRILHDVTELKYSLDNVILNLELVAGRDRLQHVTQSSTAQAVTPRDAVAESARRSCCSSRLQQSEANGTAGKPHQLIC
jgi:hypothetical protein